MGIYETLLIIGALGLALMTLMGFVHVGHQGGHGHGGHGHGLHAHPGGDAAGHTLGAHDGGAHGHAAGGHAAVPGHGGHAHGPLAHGHAAHGHGSPAHGHADHGHQHGSHEGETQGGTAYLLLGLLSPLTLFSVAFGAGVTGTLLMAIHFSQWAAAVPSVLGGWAFYAAVLEPLRRFVFSFASPPAQTLEGALLQQAEVVTSFNTRGEGIVRLTVDGQSVDVLARLEEANPGGRIVRGQRVLVEDVDTHHNTVRVSRL